MIRFEPTVPNPWKLNESAAGILEEDNKRIAAKKYVEIKDRLADLITKYPNSPAAKNASDMLDKAGLRVFSDGGIYPKDTFFSVVPYLR